MATKNRPGGGLGIDFTLKIDLNHLGQPTAINVDATPDEQDAVNSAISTAIEASQGVKPTSPTRTHTSTGKTLEDAIAEYYEKAQIKPQTKATYRSKLEHAKNFFGGVSNVYEVGQADLVRYCGLVIAHKGTTAGGTPFVLVNSGCTGDSIIIKP